MWDVKSNWNISGKISHQNDNADTEETALKIAKQQWAHYWRLQETSKHLIVRYRKRGDVNSKEIVCDYLGKCTVK